MASDILVIGAGPVGLTLACELARHGVRPRIIDQLDTPSPYCRAIGVTPRTLEVMEDMGVVRELVDAGLWLTGTRLILPGAPVKDLTLDLSDLPFAQLGVPQYATEAVLTAHLASYGISVERGIALAGLTQDAEGVDVELDTSGGRTNARFRHVVGCDGAHSAVRKALGIGFEGDAFPMEFMLGDVHIDWDLAARHDAARYPAGGRRPAGFPRRHPAARTRPLPRLHAGAGAPRRAARQRHRPRHPGRSPRRHAGRSAGRSPTGCCRRMRRCRTCAGRPCSASACGSPTNIASAMSSSPAMPATSIRRPAGRA